MASAYEISEIILSFVVLFCFVKVLQFYGANLEDYGIYITFYLFLLLSKFVLPTDIDSI
jgi:hypothetical protein